MNSVISSNRSFVLRSDAPRAPLVAAFWGSILIFAGFNIAMLIALRMPLVSLLCFVLTSPILFLLFKMVTMLKRINKAKVKFKADEVTFPVIEPGRRELLWVTVPYSAISEVRHAPAIPFGTGGNLVNESWIVCTSVGVWGLQREILGENARAAAEEICARATGTSGEEQPEIQSGPPIIPKSVRTFTNALPWVLFSCGLLFAGMGCCVLTERPAAAWKVIAVGVTMMAGSGALTSKPRERKTL